MTNADKIRGMPTEDLAETLESRCGCPPVRLCKDPNSTCVDCWVAWLNTEADDDT